MALSQIQRIGMSQTLQPDLEAVKRHLLRLVHAISWNHAPVFPRNTKDSFKPNLTLKTAHVSLNSLNMVMIASDRVVHCADARQTYCVT